MTNLYLKSTAFLFAILIASPALQAQRPLVMPTCPASTGSDWASTWDNYIKSLSGISDPIARAQKSVECVSSLADRIPVKEFQRLASVGAYNTPYVWDVFVIYLQNHSLLYDRDIEDLKILLRASLQQISFEQLVFFRDSEWPQNAANEVSKAIKKGLDESIETLEKEISSDVDEAVKHFNRLSSLQTAIGSADSYWRQKSEETKSVKEDKEWTALSIFYHDLNNHLSSKLDPIRVKILNALDERNAPENEKLKKGFGARQLEQLKKTDALLKELQNMPCPVNSK
jgi:hypothetical protein